MNERIEELAEQAGYKHPDAVGSCEDYAYFDHDKFARLIISECCVALHPMLRDMISRTQGVDMIVEHFKDKE